MKYFMSRPPCFPPESFLALPYCYVQLWSLFSNPLLQLSFFLSHLFSRSFQIRTCDPMETADWAGRWGALTQAGLREFSLKPERSCHSVSGSLECDMYLGSCW